MRSSKVIIDTGPIVAFLNRSDAYHNWAVTQLSHFVPPLYSCEPVISEACFLLRFTDNGPRSVIKLIERNLIQIPFKLDREVGVIGKMIGKYRDIPMSLADACLVRMSEQITDSIICTLDTDFRIYRKQKRQVIQLVIPDTL